MKEEVYVHSSLETGGTPHHTTPRHPYMMKHQGQSGSSARKQKKMQMKDDEFGFKETEKGRK